MHDAAFRVQFFTWEEAAQAIAENPDQTEVSLTGAEIGDEGARGLAQVLQKHHQVINLFLNGSNIGADGAAALSGPLKAQVKLETLQMTSCRIGARGLHALEPLIKRRQGLKSLILADCNARAEGARIVAAALRTNDSIKELVFRDNHLGDDGVCALAAALERNCSVIDLDLAHNEFGAVGCSALASLIEKNTVLQQLCLGQNGFAKQGVEALRPGLQRSKCLQSINLEDNNLCDDGAQVLAEALESNTTVMAIYLGNNEIGPAGGEHIADALQKRRSLKHLSRLQKCQLQFTEVLLTGNPIPREMLDRIRNTYMPSEEHSRFLKALLAGRRQMSGIPDIADRGISLPQFLHLADFVESSLARKPVRDSCEASPTHGQTITPENATMYHVCDFFVKPLTAVPHCSYTELASGKRQTPSWMISHWWGTSFTLTAKMVQFHARCRYGAENVDKAVYWCCTMANNQHDLSDLEGDVLQSPFARVLGSNECCGTVLLCDPAVTPMRRVWCVFEAHLTEQLRRHHFGSKDWHFLDVASPATGGVTSDSRADDSDTEIDIPVALLQDALGGNWHEASSIKDGRFPLEVARVGTSVQISEAEASVERDRNTILNFVAGFRGSCDLPPREHENYDWLDRFIHGVFASAELYRLAVQRPEGFLDDMAELIRLKADPNGFVRDGNTALFAAIGADSAAPNPDEDSENTVAAVDLLLKAGADPNLVNSSLKTVLDCGIEIPDRAKDLLQERGAKTYDQVAGTLEQEINDKIMYCVQRTFRRDSNPFGARTMGDSGAKILGSADRCLQAVAAILKLYPHVPCCIDSGVSLHSTQAAKSLANRQATARVLAVRDALEASGCLNPFQMQTPEGDRLLRIRLNFTKPVRTSMAVETPCNDSSLRLATFEPLNATVAAGNSSAGAASRPASAATGSRSGRPGSRRASRGVEGRRSVNSDAGISAVRSNSSSRVHSDTGLPAVGSAANAARSLSNSEAAYRNFSKS